MSLAPAKSDGLLGRPDKASVRAAGTKEANSARRADGVQDIIERHTRDLWARKPSYAGNKSKTATKIYGDVMAEVARLENIPKDWAKMLAGIDSKKNSTIDVIAKRIGRI
jgi:hypothetical protein